MQFQFDASQVDPAQGIEIWPDNTWIKVVLTKHDAKPTKNDENQGLLMWTLAGVEGAQQGKVQFLRMNLWNNNAQAVEIAKRELSALTWVTLGANQGRLQFNDFSELQNIPFYILSRHGYNNQSKQTTQDWGGFKDINGNDPGKQGNQNAQAAPAFGAPAGAPVTAPAAAPAFGQPQAAPQQAPGFGAPPTAAAPAPAFGAPPAAAPAAAPGFAPQGAAPFAAPPPAQSAPPAFGQPQQSPGAPPMGQPAGFAPPPGQAPAGAPPWQNR